MGVCHSFDKTPGRHGVPGCLQAQAKEDGGDLVVTVSVDTSAPDAAVAALRNALGAGGSLTAALADKAAVRVAADSLRVVPPAADA